ncbi:MAG: hypothetical protein NC250_09355 [Alistipes senegalensis]|nr:hypothetical protein [Bacteroides cellulosilyticus]MCM1352921.1 hypothetical protein [Alistipes senegalensis]
MKYNLKISICAMLAFALLTACSDNDLPDNPVLQSPVSGLVIEVNGENYTALPGLDDEGAFLDKMTLAVKIPSRHATIVQLNLMDGYTSDVKSGDDVMFEDNLLPITLYRNGTEAAKYWVEMSFNPPPFYYFIKSSDKDSDGNGYFLNTDNPQIMASANYDNHFEGEVDLTASNWDNVGVIASDQTKYYDFAGGPWPALSCYSWTGVEKTAAGWGYFPCDGPWNDWLVTNDNSDIVSPGIWRVNFDSETYQVDMTMTQWCVSGSAVGTRIAMTYSSEQRAWSTTAALSAGTMRFETIAVTSGDPTFDLGLASGISELASGGEDIRISEAGTYEITLVLSNPPYYTYEVVKK